MDDERKDALDVFRKERRLLLAVTVVLLAHLFLGVTVERSAESLGLKIDFGTDRNIETIVAVVWLWVFVRYWQCLYTLRPKFPADRAEETLIRIRTWLMTEDLRIEKRSALRRDYPTVKNRKLTIIAKNQIQIEDRKFVDFQTVYEWLEVPEGAKDNILRNRSIVMNERVPVPKDTFGASLMLAWSRLWTFLWTSYGTEYILPGLLGALPFLVWFYRGLLITTLPPLLRHP